jgi:predicted esterase
MHAKTIATTIHGRFLYRERDPRLLLVGFHGYAETAEIHMSELEKIPDAEEWSLLAIQALHPFYTRTGTVVASWMTSLDREHAIADNLAFIRAVLESVPGPESLVFAGFSQGASMAARAAAHVGQPAGLILLGGDIPPEIKADAALRLPPTLLGRGERDDWYSPEKFKQDLSYLTERSTVLEHTFDGGHEWTDGFREAAGRFLRSVSDRVGRSG